MSWLKPFRGCVFFVVVLGFWQVVGNPDSVLLPTPSRWWAALGDLSSAGQLWPAAWQSLRLFVESMMAGVVLGVALGLAIGGSSLLNRMLGSLIDYCRSIPTAVFVPSVLILFGLSQGTQIGIVVFASIWPVLLGTAGARRALPEERLEMAKTLNFGWWKTMRKIVFPSLIPEIGVGVRVAVPICFLLTMLVGFLMGTGGLGYQLMQSQQSFRSAEAWALTAFVGVLGILITLIVDRSERYATRHWPAAHRS